MPSLPAPIAASATVAPTVAPIRVGVIGATGYVGGELIRLLGGAPGGRAGRADRTRTARRPDRERASAPRHDGPRPRQRAPRRGGRGLPRAAPRDGGGAGPRAARTRDHGDRPGTRLPAPGRRRTTRAGTASSIPIPRSSSGPSTACRSSTGPSWSPRARHAPPGRRRSSGRRAATRRRPCSRWRRWREPG